MVRDKTITTILRKAAAHDRRCGRLESLSTFLPPFLSMSWFLDLSSFEHEILLHFTFTFTVGLLDAHEQTDHNPLLSSIGQHITDEERPVPRSPLAFTGAHSNLSGGQELLHLAYDVALHAARMRTQ
ncbi:MAG: hypothetical protein A2Z07_11495 [Armatimonadetes bacterium RBG_16_67_12]|nr:MAG: hypothetical protein A2Z07_11495 [Armatimonadetes bacterium RBG_16_67_12]